MAENETQQVAPPDETVPPQPQQPTPNEGSEGSEDDTFLAGINADNATLLLAAAEEAGLDQSVVQVDNYRGGFTAPAEVVRRAKDQGNDDSDKE